MKRKKMQAAALLLSGVGLCWMLGLATRADDQELDVVMLGGRVMDPESGLDAVRNVGVRSGKIVVVSEKPLKGNETIDAKGLVVSPGFIDLHQHGQDDENYRVKAADGVTTALEMEVGTRGRASIHACCNQFGNCGSLSRSGQASRIMSRSYPRFTLG
jgi:hypothetical protein